MDYLVHHGHLVMLHVQVCRLYHINITTLLNLILFIKIVMPHCEDYTDCSGCAKQDQCAWCASENLCTTVADAFSKDCRGLVFELPCPENYIVGMIKYFLY